MIKNLSSSKCSCGVFSITSGTVTSVSIPDDAIGVKMYSTGDYFFNVNDNPGEQVSDTLAQGGFGVGGVMEKRILQDGTGRVLKVSAASDCDVKIEFWG